MKSETKNLSPFSDSPSQVKQVNLQNPTSQKSYFLRSKQMKVGSRYKLLFIFVILVGEK